ncbi:MAG: hypothetical protein FJ146_00580 [Deltaproteobacteria bacterium]|nr:hypothetical protein [Deltaproteobacteria bacterium]
MSIIKLIIALCIYAWSITLADEGIKSSPSIQAEPISPSTAQHHPHLEPYIGHVLLSSPKVQVVLAGVALKPSQAQWQPAVLAFFALDSQFGPPAWVRRRAISGIDLSINPGQSSPSSVHQLALDTGLDADGKGAFARFLYGNKSITNRTIQVTWHLDAASGRLTFLLEPQQAGLTSATHSWQLRLLGVGSYLVGPTVGSGKFASSEYLYSYNGTDLISVIGYRGLILKTEQNALESAPVQPPLAPPADGVEFDLSLSVRSDSSLARVRALKQCAAVHSFKQQHKSRDDFWGALSGCETNHGTATLSIDRVAVDQQRVALPVFLFNAAGQPVSYTVAQTHKPSVLLLPAPGDYYLADTPYGRLIEGITPIKLEPASSHHLTLPLQPTGRFNLKSEQIGIVPRLLVIEPMGPSGLGTGVVFDDSSTEEPPQEIDRQVWLLRSKVAQATLREGSYQISVVNGHGGIICRQRLTIAAGAQSTMNCTTTLPDAATEFGSNFLFANINPIVAPEVSPKVPLSADLRQALMQGLGLDLAGESLTTAQKNGASLDVSFLEVKSDQFDARLRYWPATIQLGDRWRQAQLGPGDESFSRFVKFLRDEGESGWIELLCPNDTLGTEDLEQIIRDVKPTALQFFGCRTSHDHDALIALWSRVSTHFDPPMLLTAAPVNLHDQDVPFLPRIAIAARPSSLATPVDIWTAMQKRSFSLSAGATIQINGLHQTEVKNTEGRNWELQVTVTTTPQVRAREILVYSESGLIKRAYPPHDFEQNGTITIQAVPIAQSNWIRVELRGTTVSVINNFDSSGETSTRSDEAVLAATNFNPVIHHRAKHERPEVQH